MNNRCQGLRQPGSPFAFSPPSGLQSWILASPFSCLSHLGIRRAGCLATTRPLFAVHQMLGNDNLDHSATVSVN